MFKTFKQYIGEAGPGGSAPPTAGGPAPAPQAGGGTPATTNTGASQALVSQSNGLGQQIQMLNTKLQKLMQQKAIIDRQIGQANSSASSQNQGQTGAAQATIASGAATPGGSPTQTS